MPVLYDKFTDGDRRTVVRKVKKGTELHVPGPATIVIKADVVLKVTQQYFASSRMWIDIIFHTKDMVETVVEFVKDEEQAPAPKPDPEHVELPKATLIERLRGWFR